MSKYTSYECQLCDTTFAQKEHHKNHIKSKAHKQEEKIKKLELEKLSEDELMETYNNNNISKIIKKLSKNKINTITKIQNENTNFNNFGIGTKEAMKDKVHSIHNFLRNNGAGYGMNALKLFNLFYGLAKIEKNGHFENTGLDECCKFSNILKKFKDNNQLGIEYVHENIMNEIYSNSNVNYMLAVELPDGFYQGDKIKHFLIMVNELCEMEDKLNFQLAGKIYEYFIGRDQTAISELGAYFTDRHIINYIYENLLGPNLDDNSNVKTMIDMFGGSGGFTLGYLNYFNENNNINWKEQLKNIYHYDMNIDVVKYAMLEMYCITGEFPNKDNIKVTNSFTNDFGQTDKFNYIVTNPPYGGDKVTKSEEVEVMELLKKQIETYFKTIHKVKNMKQVSKLKLNEKDKNKVKQYDIVYKKLKDIDIEIRSRTVQLNNSALRFQNYGKNNNIDISKCKDKEAVSFLMMMEMLKEGGTAIGVLKEGLFFDSKYQHLRKHLVENFNVEKIVSIDASQFENTTTKTSIIMFHNNGKTEKIKFYDMIINKENKTELIEQGDGTFKLNTIKNRIINVSDKLITTARYNDIVKEDYTFNHKKYNKVELKTRDGFKMVQLGDICEFLPKSKRLASFSNETGKYRFYSSGSKILKCNKADYKDKNILIIGHSGDGCLFVDNEFSTLLTNHLLYLNNKEKLQYLYYSLKILWKEFYYSCYDGSTVKNTSDKNISKFNIPIPKEQKDIEYWVNYISEPYNAIQEYKTKLLTLEEKVKQDIQNILNNNKIEEVMLGNLCESIKTGKNKTPDNKSGTKYPYYGTSSITGYTDHYLFDGKNILLARNGTMGNCFITNGKIYPSDHIFIIKVNKINLDLMYYLIKMKSNEIKKLSNGSTIKGISKDILKQIKIQLPKDRSILDTLNPIFEEIDKLNKDLPKQEELYNARLEELRKAAIKD